MSILKFENRTPRTLEDMYQYLLDPSKTDSTALFGLGLNPLYAVPEIKYVQDIYFYSNLSHPYIQVIFSFDVGVSYDTPILKQISMDIGSCLVLDARQVLGVIHYKNTDKKHCHYLINYVGINGNLYRQHYPITHYKARVNEVLLKYDLSPIMFYGFPQLQVAI